MPQDQACVIKPRLGGIEKLGAYPDAEHGAAVRDQTQEIPVLPGSGRQDRRECSSSGFCSTTAEPVMGDRCDNVPGSGALHIGVLAVLSRTGRFQPTGTVHLERWKGVAVWDRRPE